VFGWVMTHPNIYLLMNQTVGDFVIGIQLGYNYHIQGANKQGCRAAQISVGEQMSRESSDGQADQSKQVRYPSHN
jgi:hypothetical protein